jgi:hypothetical protein
MYLANPASNQEKFQIEIKYLDFDEAGEKEYTQK